jgi:hypothetical protein
MARAINHYRRCDVCDVHTRRETLGAFDAKGRECGMVIQLLTVTVGAGAPAADAPDQLETFVEPGRWLAANVQTARDGKPYGASQRSRYFRSEAERASYIRARVEQARKRMKPRA